MWGLERLLHKSTAPFCPSRDRAPDPTSDNCRDLDDIASLLKAHHLDGAVRRTLVWSLHMLALDAIYSTSTSYNVKPRAPVSTLTIRKKAQAGTSSDSRKEMPCGYERLGILLPWP